MFHQDSPFCAVRISHETVMQDCPSCTWLRNSCLPAKPQGDLELGVGERFVIWMFPKIVGKPPKWMVYFMENPIKIDDFWGYHYFRKHPYESTKQKEGKGGRPVYFGRISLPLTMLGHLNKTLTHDWIMRRKGSQLSVWSEPDLDW